MANAPINEVMNNALRDTLETWKKKGLSDEEIISKIEKIDYYHF